MKNILILFIFFACLGAEDLSDSDKALLDKATSSHLSAAEKAYDAYQNALNEAAVKTLKDLEKIKTDAMKKGNLALANAVDAAEKQVKAGSLGDAVVAGTNVDLLGNVVVSETDKKESELCSVVWLRGSETWYFTKDGKFSANTAWVGGQWKYIQKNKVVRITWDNGSVQDFPFNDTLTHPAGDSFKRGDAKKEDEKLP